MFVDKGARTSHRAGERRRDLDAASTPPSARSGSRRNVHTVGSAPEAGSRCRTPTRGRRTGFKKDETHVVISKLNESPQGDRPRDRGQYVHVTTASASAARITAAIEGMEQRTLAQE